MNLHKIVGLLGILVSIVGAFVPEIPYCALILLVLGLVAGWEVAGEQHVRVIVSALALTGFSGALNAVPAVGGYLATIVAGLGAFSVGGALTIIVRNMVMRFKP